MSGIRDSKNISSDKKISELAEKIRKTPGCVTDSVVIGNEAYNRLYAKMKSVNTLLAWGHARVIENLLGKRYQMNPPPVKAISDQFAASKSVIEKALMAQGKGLQLVQRHKAEEDIAVAAASILARDEFVKGLAKLEKQFGMKLPKGASARRWMRRRKNLWKNAARANWRKFPSCISARHCARKVCLSRRRRSGGRTVRKYGQTN